MEFLYKLFFSRKTRNKAEFIRSSGGNGVEKMECRFEKA